jgi:hypothetical protein
MDGSGTIRTGIVVLADWVRAFLAVVPNQAIVGLRTSTFVGAAALAVFATLTASPVLCSLGDRVLFRASLFSCRALIGTTLDTVPTSRIDVTLLHLHCHYWLPTISHDESA